MTVKVDKSRLFDILQDYSNGLSYRKIGERQGLSKDKVMDILRLINLQTADELRDIIISEIPLQWRSSLILLRSISDKAHQIASDPTTRKEVVLQALQLQLKCMSESNSLLTDSVKIYNALQKVKERRTTSTKAEHSEAIDTETADEDGQIDGEDLITTSDNKQDPPDFTSENESISGSLADNGQDGEVREESDNEDGAAI